jgi:hypothetical protein
LSIEQKVELSRSSNWLGIAGAGCDNAASNAIDAAVRICLILAMATFVNITLPLFELQLPSLTEIWFTHFADFKAP